MNGKRESHDGKRESHDGKRESHDGKRESHDGKRENHDGKRENENYNINTSDYNKMLCNFIKIDDKNWKCILCNKHMIQQSKKHHSNVACFRYKNGKNLCLHCNKYYEKVNSRMKHEKICSINKKITHNSYKLKELKENDGESYRTNNNNNNNTINNTNTTTNIINITTNNNTIVLNQFGVEGWDYLWKLCSNEYRSEFDKLKTQLLTQGLDGISKLIEIHYFNKDYPKNHTIRKPIKNNDFVEVHIGNNEWEHKTIETALEEIKQSTSMYLRPLLDSIIETNYKNDEKIQKYTNKMFTDILVPMKYDMYEEYKDKLSNIDPLSFHISQQNEQINARKMKTVLYELSSKLKTLSDNINL